MGEVCLFGKSKKQSGKKEHFSKICVNISKRKILHAVIFFKHGVAVGLKQNMLVTIKVI